MHLTYIYNHLLQHKKLLELLLFRHTALIQIFYLHLNVPPFKKLLFLGIGLQMFKYEYGQLPDALNMFFVRIDLCIIKILETKTNSALLLLSMYTETRDVRLVGVHVWNYICDNINIDTPFASFKRIQKKLFLLKNVCFI